ncbi:MAG TPA: twin-arginine translocase subunit TatC, partial [Opitutales bacterium]|nr:twin-arginine translocase subunit TatC [Opitutales bacterium]
GDGAPTQPNDSGSKAPPPGEPTLMPESVARPRAKPQTPPKKEEPELFKGLLTGTLFGGDGEGDDADADQPQGRRKKKQRSEMGFFEHLEELRWTILKSAFAAAIGMGIIALNFKWLFHFLRKPLEWAVGVDKANATLISPLDPMGGITMAISVSIYGGAILALPVITYFIARFIAPGLTFKEKGMLRPALASALVLFTVGVLGCFFLMLPAGLRFAYNFNHDTLGYQNLWSANNYYSLVVWATLAMGLAFEFPLILVILQVLGILSPQTLRSGRRFAILIIAVVSGLLAPSPDIYSMISMMIPMLILYEGSIIIGALLRKRRVAAKEKREAEEAAKY